MKLAIAYLAVSMIAINLTICKSKRKRHSSSSFPSMSSISSLSTSSVTDSLSFEHSSSRDHSPKEELLSSTSSSEDSKDTKMQIFINGQHKQIFSNGQNKQIFINGHNSEKLLDFDGDIRAKFAFAALSSRPTESVVCSPASALFPLGMLLFGAEGDTQRELLSAVGIRSKSDAHMELTKLINHLKYLSGVTLDIASRMYLSKEKRLRDDFLSEAERVFKACTALVDMKRPTDTARYINSWVDHETHGRIKDLLRPSDVPTDASLVLVNAIYFSGKWKHKFESVTDAPFYGPRGEQRVPMMYIKSSFNYATSDAINAEIIVIPYNDDSASLIVVLPHRRDGLPQLLQLLQRNPAVLNTIKLNKVKVQLHLPKFKIESDFDLKALYEKIGLRRMFSENGSGLTKVIRDERVFVDKGIQKAVIEVTEVGTKAAAASEIAINYVMLDSRRVVCDHPFLFFIVADKQQIFAGTLNSV